jgi:pectate disaccharide-lyase
VLRFDFHCSSALLFNALCFAAWLSGCSGDSGTSLGSGGEVSAAGSSSTGGAAASGGQLASTGGTPSSSVSTGGAVASSGGAGTGGAVATGGTTANGTNGLGGTKATGGAATGGTKAAGGSSAMGGAITTGGAIATGGRVSTGGAITTGGVVATGGRVSTGGGVATGGTATGGTKATGGATTGGANATGGTAASSNDLWIATNGSDTNPGTEALPLATLSAAHSKVSAGQTIWIKPGTYSWSSTVKLTKNGTSSSPINVFAASGTRPVIDFSGQSCGDSAARGIQITGTYWHLKGFDVQKAGDNCIHIGGSHNTIEWVATHNCCDSGLQITADTASDSSRGAYNTVLNCDSYENYDSTNGGENADGFSPKLHIGPGNVFRGCRSWNNSDDGFDLFASDDVVVIENCWAFLNGKLANGGGTSNGDGNGFKLGGAATAGDAYEGGAPHQVTNCFAFENTACGFTRNNNTSVPVLTSCGGRSDGKGEYCSLTNSSSVSFTMTGAQAKAVARNSDGSLPAIH